MSWLTLGELQLFHNIDRVAYAKLVYQLGLDSDTSMRIVALWKWLETKGYRNFVYNSVNLTESSFEKLSGLALESTLCLSCLDLKSFLHDNDDLPLMSGVSDRELSLEFVFWNMEDAKASVIAFVRDVCQRAFVDLIPRNNLYHHVQFCVPDFDLLQPQVSILPQEGNGNHSANQEDNEASNDRTLFVTFSRGHPITIEELSEFFRGKFGENCVEEILMGKRHSQSLFARVTVRSPEYITQILGENEVKQFNIHNKDIRVRRFIEKHQLMAADSESAN